MQLDLYSAPSLKREREDDEVEDEKNIKNQKLSGRPRAETLRLKPKPNLPPALPERVFLNLQCKAKSLPSSPSRAPSSLSATHTFSKKEQRHSRGGGYVSGRQALLRPLYKLTSLNVWDFIDAAKKFFFEKGGVTGSEK